MAKHTKIDVRVHSQEREWLLNLGEGNIVEGVRNLIQQMTGKESKWDDYPTGKSGKGSKWGSNW